MGIRQNGFDHRVSHCGALYSRASMTLYVPLGSSPKIGRARPHQIGEPADAEEAWSIYHCSTAHISCENRGKRSWALLTFSARYDLSAPVSCLRCCSAVAWSRGSRAWPTP